MASPPESYRGGWGEKLCKGKIDCCYHKRGEMGCSAVQHNKCPLQTLKGGACAHGLCRANFATWAKTLMSKTHCNQAEAHRSRRPGSVTNCLPTRARHDLSPLVFYPQFAGAPLWALLCAQWHCLSFLFVYALIPQLDLKLASSLETYTKWMFNKSLVRKYS